MNLDPLFAYQVEVFDHAYLILLICSIMFIVTIGTLTRYFK